jgi:hypothetical protein
VLVYTDNTLKVTDFTGDQVLVSSKSKQISIASLGGLIDVMIFDTAAKDFIRK